jgi:hypothetical protein
MCQNIMDINVKCNKCNVSYTANHAVNTKNSPHATKFNTKGNIMAEQLEVHQKTEMSTKPLKPRLVRPAVFITVLPVKKW